MGLAEVVHRGINSMKVVLEQCGIGLARVAEPGDSSGRPWLIKFPTGLDGGAYVAAATSLMRGRYVLFGAHDFTTGFPPTWNRDPKTGTTAPLRYGKTLNYRDERIVGEVKYLWELNRHLELVTLAQTWRVTGETAYLAACRRLLDSWFEQCPYPLGPNWCSSLELAVRLVNWAFAWHLLGGVDSPLFLGEDGRSFRGRWLQSVRQHCHFIAGWPSLHSSANNHLLGEQLGLFVAATTWPCWDESKRWQAASRLRFEEEVLRQNAPDGVNREQSTWYQHEVIDMMLIGGLFARANSVDFGLAYWERLEAMLEFIASIMDVRGHVPAIGDSDDAVIVRLAPAQGECVFRSQLASAAVLFDRAEFKEKARSFDEKSRWLLGDDGEKAFCSLPAGSQSLPLRRSFPDGGYYVLGSDFETDKEVRIVADVGPLGYLSIAAHGHADALSFMLAVAGREVLVDPGTYTYRSDTHWRPYFRGTAAHNTVRVDGRDQSEYRGSFLWSVHAQSTCDVFDASGDCEVLAGRHDGYLRIARPVEHRRTLRYWKSRRVLQIEDALIGYGRHRVEVNWHFAEHCTVEIRGNVAIIDTDGVTIELEWPPEMLARLVRGSDDPPAGWRSRRLAERTPCSTIVTEAFCAAPWRAVFEMRLLRLSHSTGATSGTGT
jgi:hypothetical protein